MFTTAKSVDEKRPVMVWIHGGGNVIGSAEFATSFGNRSRESREAGCYRRLP